MNYLLYIIAGVAGLVIGSWMAKRKHFTPNKPSFAEASKEELSQFHKESKKALSERTEDRKEKILEMMRDAREDFSMGCNLREGENQKGIARSDVEKLLDVSADTADKYLNELEVEKKIEQVGKTGRGVFYILVK
ncbi:MAG: hypothetical protein ABII97_00955 [Patescibacteria group bacterium]